MERSRVTLLLLVECFSIAVGDCGIIPAGRAVVELVAKLLVGCNGNRDGLNGGRSAGSGLNENGCVEICGCVNVGGDNDRRRLRKIGEVGLRLVASHIVKSAGTPLKGIPLLSTKLPYNGEFRCEEGTECPP